MSVKEGDACGKLDAGDYNCECKCFIDKGICVAAVKCWESRVESGLL